MNTLLSPSQFVLQRRYRVEEYIGRGAISEVFRATNIGTGGKRALKVISRNTPGLSEHEFSEYGNSLMFEGRLYEFLKDSPYILKVYELEEEGELLIHVLDYAAGGSLADYITQHHPIPIRELLHLSLCIAEGLSAMHKEHIIHRDLRPANVLLDSQKNPQLADFGHAQAHKISGSSIFGSMSKYYPGARAYMSPEQENRKGYLQANSDVYSFGCLVLEMLTGQVYKEQRPGTSLSSLRPDTPDWLESLVQRCVSIDQEKRPWNGIELCELIKEGIQEEIHKKSQTEEQIRMIEGEIVRLKEEAQNATDQNNWSRAQLLADRLGQFGLKGKNTAREIQEIISYESSLEEKRTLEIREEMANKINTLQEDAEIALNNRNWSNVKRLILELEGLEQEGQEAADQLINKLPPYWKRISPYAWIISFLIFIAIIIVGIFGLRGCFVFPISTAEEDGITDTPTQEIVEVTPSFTITPSSTMTSTSTATLTSTPTLTLTFTPTATPTFTPSPTPLPIAIVKYDNANVRYGPSSLYPVILKLSKGDERGVLGQSPDGTFIVIQLVDDREGWIALELLDLGIDIATLEQFNIPPTPILYKATIENDDFDFAQIKGPHGYSVLDIGQTTSINLPAGKYGFSVCVPTYFNVISREVYESDCRSEVVVDVDSDIRIKATDLK